jgi:hypothetical protein
MHFGFCPLLVLRTRSWEEPLLNHNWVVPMWRYTCQVMEVLMRHTCQVMEVLMRHTCQVLKVLKVLKRA